MMSLKELDKLKPFEFTYNQLIYIVSLKYTESFQVFLQKEDAEKVYERWKVVYDEHSVKLTSKRLITGIL